ncbi:ribosomal protein L7/L12 [Collinsella intestinalis]|uniref:ribosomal protein L7/L12 n=1 Tax=Collinsella intestinalis TaxID=147207 RepID=UPI001957C63C|nr:ribosomal protein L7/L12 [Collinsella intestinalis]MBM6941551.1 ribosomal protein L7/L12 [Collinsella intestinalis]
MAGNAGNADVRDYYELLGLDPSLSAAELFEELDVLSAQYADRAAMGGTGADEVRERYRLCSEATRVFESDESRAAYDRQLAAQRTAKPAEEAAEEPAAPTVDWMARTRSYFESGDYAAARVASDKLRIDRRDDPEAFVLSADILLRSDDENDFKQARRFADEALVLDIDGSREWKIREVRARSLAALGDLQAARNELERAYRVASAAGRPPVCLTMAQTIRATGDVREAYAWAMKGLADLTDPGANEDRSAVMARLVRLVYTYWCELRLHVSGGRPILPADTVVNLDMSEVLKAWGAEIGDAPMPPEARAVLKYHISACWNALAAYLKELDAWAEDRGRKAAAWQHDMDEAKRAAAAKKSELDGFIKQYGHAEEKLDAAEQARQKALGLGHSIPSPEAEPYKAFPLARCIGLVVTLLLWLFVVNINQWVIPVTVLAILVALYFMSGLRCVSLQKQTHDLSGEAQRLVQRIEQAKREVGEADSRVLAVQCRPDNPAFSTAPAAFTMPAFEGLSAVFASAETGATGAEGTAFGAGGATPYGAGSRFDVVVEDYGDNMIMVIKVMRKLTGMGLGEAKEFADSLPRTLLEGVDRATADSAQRQLVEAGGHATVRASAS